MTTNQKKKAVLIALENSAGNVSVACKNVGISRESFYRWKKADKKFNKKVDEVEQRNLDLAETKLLERVNGRHYTEEHHELKKNKETGEMEMVLVKTVKKYIPPSDSAIALLLKTKGKSRGYVEKQVHDVTVNNVSERISFSIVKTSKNGKKDSGKG